VTTNSHLDRFKEIWSVDFEYIALEGERPFPVCLAAKELRSGRQIRLWRNEFGETPPYSIGPESLFVSFNASAEFSCHLVLGWPRPSFILDLYCEYKNLVNGRGIIGFKLLDALRYFGLSGISSVEKEDMRGVIIRGGPWSWKERNEILDYCETDVRAVAELFPLMLPLIDLPEATVRGRYMHAVACMEHVGVPFDMEKWNRMRERWDFIQDALIAEVDSAYHVYENGSFRRHLFAEYLIRNNIPWPVLKSGELELTDDVFKERSKAFPQLLDLRYLRDAQAKMRLFSFSVGQDGFNRAWLNPFWTKTSRNQPSPRNFIFGAASWIRGLIKPPPGFGLCYMDYVQQEFGIAAALSGDPAMKAAYESGDSYLWFAKQTGAVPPDATKESHEQIRDQFKECVLGTQFGVGEEALASQINQPISMARYLLRLHRTTFRRYWEWLDEVVNHSFLNAIQSTVYGWKERITEINCNARGVGNFFCQANGAEMLRLTCIFGTEGAIQLCAPVHDAALFISPLDRLDADIAAMRGFMEKASEYVLDGFKLRTETQIIRYPDRYMKKKGKEMWDRIEKYL
jgi:DNA polymerase-1